MSIAYWMSVQKDCKLRETTVSWLVIYLTLCTSSAIPCLTTVGALTRIVVNNACAAHTKQDRIGLYVTAAGGCTMYAMKCTPSRFTHKLNGHTSDDIWPISIPKRNYGDNSGRLKSQKAPGLSPNCD
ncbi:hypothetical protein DFH06DRAFT_454113 [Mycena polygramma]|nr:hypothetical protein DFH06DRAFT_454113 [Mycena polygramma]